MSWYAHSPVTRMARLSNATTTSSYRSNSSRAALLVARASRTGTGAGSVAVLTSLAVVSSLALSFVIAVASSGASDIAAIYPDVRLDWKPSAGRATARTSAE